MSELDERKAAVLRAVVEEFIKTAQPVGSQRLAKGRALRVSSATIRNDMSVLEREGYLRHPHTSAGRVPTDKGYRFFVDGLDNADRLAPPDRQTVSEFFATAQTALEELLHETSQLLARITDQAALVVGPQAEAAHVLTTQLVLLHPDAVLVVAVLSSGAVEKTVVRLDGDVGPDVVARAAAALATAATGAPLREFPDPVIAGQPEADALARTAAGALRAIAAVSPSEPVYIGGTSRIAAEVEDFTAVETVARLLELLEQQYLVVSLAHSLLDAGGVTVRIGDENDRAELKECSLVLAPVLVEGSVAGTLGILGPTRMDYAKAMAAVATVSDRLGRHLRA
jgi:heat-inducible transcriptional repressor